MSDPERWKRYDAAHRQERNEAAKRRTAAKRALREADPTDRIKNYPGTGPNIERRNAAARARYAKNREAFLARQREVMYGVTDAEYGVLLAAQGGVCAICRQPETALRDGSVRSLCVDHHHGTGHVRGLLCSRCNTALGLLKDDPDRLRAALTYLEEPTDGEHHNGALAAPETGGGHGRAGAHPQEWAGPRV